MKKINLACLASGRGSNFAAIMNNITNGKLAANMQCLVVNKPNAGALDIAKDYQVAAHTVIKIQSETPSQYELRILDILKNYPIDFIVLAGYMKIVGPTLLNAYPNKILNIHPSLLPQFPGLDAQAQAIACGAKVSGCTVHLVDAGMDTGPIIMQRQVLVHPSDTASILSQRILTEEHKLYSDVLQLLAEEKISLQDGKILINK